MQAVIRFVCRIMFVSSNRLWQINLLGSKICVAIFCLEAGVGVQRLEAEQNVPLQPVSCPRLALGPGLIQAWRNIGIIKLSREPPCASEFFILSLKSLPQSSSEPRREGQAAHATLLQSPIVSLIQRSTQIEASFPK